MKPPPMSVTDIAELAELLEFLGDWLASHGDRRVDRSLMLFSGYGRDTKDLRAELARFSLLLGMEEERLVGGPT